MRRKRRRGEVAHAAHGSMPLSVDDIRDLAKVAERFWAKVDTTGDCWLWTGQAYGVGYGVMTVGIGSRGFRSVMTHRLSYLLAYGYLPADRDICHTCDVRCCVRPAHLFAGTARDNARDRERKGRGNQSHDSAHVSAKLTEGQVREIRQRAATGEGSTALSRAYGVSVPSILDIVRRQSWRHLE